MLSIADIRKDYRLRSLNEADTAPDPLGQFERWWKEAEESKIEEINAMTLATADKNGNPSARIVLLKGLSDQGFDFYTNYESRKGEQLEENPKAAIVFFWKELERQVRIEGIVVRLSAEANDAYFQSRPPGSRIGAWASPQSKEIPDRDVLETRAAELADRFKAESIPRPDFWGGYRVVPARIEFWQGRANRLHDRIVYEAAQSGWIKKRLAP